MKISPVSADLLIKLALGALVVGAGVYAVRKIAAGAASVADAAGEVLDTVATGVNPASPDNVVNRGVSAIGGALVTDPAGPGKNADGSWTLGGWIYDVTH